jgi:hypothetical protein
MKKTGIELIAQERQEQIEKHNYSQDFDLQVNNHYQLSQAAGLLTWLDEEDYGHDIEACCPVEWDLDIWHKMMTKSYEERLAIAGALCAAEIDRLNALEG